MEAGVLQCTVLDFDALLKFGPVSLTTAYVSVLNTKILTRRSDVHQPTIFGNERLRLLVPPGWAVIVSERLFETFRVLRQFFFQNQICYFIYQMQSL
jgi:hypothetical protein